MRRIIGGIAALAMIVVSASGAAAPVAKKKTITAKHPVVAKNPNAMHAGNSGSSTFKLEGKTLVLTQVSTQSGPVANPITLRLTRVE